LILLIACLSRHSIITIEAPAQELFGRFAMGLKGVMIGAGYFAQFQADAWRRIEGAQIVAVADAAPGRAEAFSERWGIPRAYHNIAEMFERERPILSTLSSALTHISTSSGSPRIAGFTSSVKSPWPRAGKNAWRWTTPATRHMFGC